MAMNDPVPPTVRYGRASSPDLSSLARALAEPARARMVLAVMDGRAWTIGELAREAGVAADTVSDHAARLVDAGVVTQRRQGRHRYLTLAGPQVAAAVEAMALVVPTRPAGSSLRARRSDAELANGRTCYRHLAGRLGVAITDGWRRAGLLTAQWSVTAEGRAWFEGIGVDIRPPDRRPMLRPCLDWTERRDHAAGPLADRFAAAGLAAGWFRRGSHPRSMALTASGREFLDGLDVPDVASA